MMKRKSFLLTIVLAVFLLSPLIVHAAVSDIRSSGARGTESVNEGDAVSYVIIKHDTLWDISERFLRDPFKWPSIWKVNPYIKNPDLIYPGDVVKIIPIEEGFKKEEKKEEEFDVGSLPVVTVEPGAGTVVVLTPEVKKEEKPAPPVPHYSSTLMKKKGFIGKDGLKASGEIMKAKENAILLGEGDRVFISLKDNSGVHTGDSFTIFRKTFRVKHPVTGKKLGYMIDILGTLVVTENTGVVQARIDKSFKEIEVGARLMPLKKIVSEVAITTSPAGLDGYIIATTEERLDLSKGDIVYIDRGKKDGVQAGNTFDIYRFRKKARDPVTGKKVELPADKVGSLVVIKPGKRTSSCIITQSLTAVRTGYFVKTAVKE